MTEPQSLKEGLAGAKLPTKIEYQLLKSETSPVAGHESSSYMDQYKSGETCSMTFYFSCASKSLIYVRKRRACDGEYID